MCLSDKQIASDQDERILWETELFRLSHADFCAWPAYLILRLKGPERSLAQLSPAEAAAFGHALAHSARALECVAGAQRVYLLSFAEVDRQLHVHLLARTAALANAWREATGAGVGPVDGPALFQWVREAWPAGSTPPVELKQEALCAALRVALADVPL